MGGSRGLCEVGDSGVCMCACVCGWGLGCVCVCARTQVHAVEIKLGLS